MAKEVVYEEEVDQLIREEKKVKIRLEKMRDECTHVRSDGRTFLKPTGKPFIHQCTRCKTIIDISQMANDYEQFLKDLKESSDFLKNVLEVVKYRLELSKTTSEFITPPCIRNALTTLRILPEILNSIRNSRKPKDKNKKENNREGLLYGTTSLSLRADQNKGRVYSEKNDPVKKDW